jgi:hypothetical protein
MNELVENWFKFAAQTRKAALTQVKESTQDQLNSPSSLKFLQAKQSFWVGPVHPPAQN